MEDELIKDKDNICLESGKQSRIQPFVNRGGKRQEDEQKWKQMNKEDIFHPHTPGKDFQVIAYTFLGKDIMDWWLKKRFKLHFLVF